jgi:hypothetical protein
MIWVVGVVASGLAILGRFGGLFQGWETQLSGHLGVGQRGLPLWVEIVCAVLFAFGTAIVGMQVTSSRYRFGLIAAILLQPLSATAVGALTGTWVSPCTWLVAIIAALAGVAGYRVSAAGKRERLIRQIYGKNLSEASLARLLQQPDALTPKTRPSTVLSARYLGNEWAEIDALASRLREQSAWVEVQTGNRLLAVWNMPLELGTSAVNAVESTLDLAADWQVGVATGDVIGECLPETNLWQMRGAAFEKADALCQANTTFGSRVLLDLTTADLVRDLIVLRPVDLFVLPATELAVEIFEPLALTTKASEEAVAQRDRFWEGVIFFRQKRFSEAQAAFQKSGDDPVVLYYRKRLEKLTSSY